MDTVLALISTDLAASSAICLKEAKKKKMNIELFNSDRKQLILMEEPEGYLIPNQQTIIETIDLNKGEELYEERRRIHLDGVYINYYKRSIAQERQIWVRSDAPYIQMHFEISGGSAYYYHKNKQFTVPIATGEFSLFYVPNLDGKLVDPPCKNAITVEIEISESWLLKHLDLHAGLVLNFINDINNCTPSLLGGKVHQINPQISKTIQELFDCPYTGSIKRLYLEAKLLELLAHQLQQASTFSPTKFSCPLTKIDIEQLYALKDRLLADLSINYTIDELAYLSYMNRTKLQAGFKELFGKTLHEFIIENRMLLAYKLLLESYANNWNIAEIAKRVGYKHSNHFSTAFKKKFGKSPAAFVKRSY